MMLLWDTSGFVISRRGDGSLCEGEKWRGGGWTLMSPWEWCHIDEILTLWFMATLPRKWSPVFVFIYLYLCRGCTLSCYSRIVSAASAAERESRNISRTERLFGCLFVWWMDSTLQHFLSSFMSSCPFRSSFLNITGFSPKHFIPL